MADMAGVPHRGAGDRDRDRERDRDHRDRDRPDRLDRLDRGKRSAGAGRAPIGSAIGWSKITLAAAVALVASIVYFTFQLQKPKLLSLANSTEEQLRAALTGVEPHIFYCQEGIESPPTMFMAAQQQRGTQFVFATLNCSQILPSGKSIFSKFGLKKLSRQPTVFGVAPWSKHQQVPKAGLVDTKSLVSFLDNAFAPKPRPVSSDKELNSFCGFAKDIASTKHSVTSTCIVLQRGQQHNDYHTQLEEKLVKSYPRSKVAVIDANSKRFSFEGPQSKPAEDISLEIFAVRNGTHFLQMNNKALTWDYVNTFVAQAIATPLYGFDEEPYGAVRLVKSKKTMFKDRSQPKPPPGQQDQQERSSRSSKKSKSERSSSSGESASASGGSGKDDTGDRIRAERRAAREAKEREQRDQERQHQDEEPEEDEEIDSFEEDNDEDIIEL
jgi:hypothetical protein